MTNAEHLIENVISALNRTGNVEEELNKPYNQIMLAESGINKDDIIAMANHIVYSLYEGFNPFSKNWMKLMNLWFQWNNSPFDFSLYEADELEQESS